MIHLFEVAALWIVHWLISSEGQAALQALEADLLTAMENASGGTSTPPTSPPAGSTGSTGGSSPAYFNPKASSVPSESGVSQ